MKDIRPCKACRTSTLHQLTRQLFENGTEHVGWRCPECSGWSPSKGGHGIWIAKQKLIDHGVDVESLPIVAASLTARCIVCGSRGAELHHWAPRGIFGAVTADKWPTDYLCRPCHMLWHDTVTPKLMGGGA